MIRLLVTTTILSPHLLLTTATLLTNTFIPLSFPSRLSPELPRHCEFGRLDMVPEDKKKQGPSCFCCAAEEFPRKRIGFYICVGQQRRKRSSSFQLVSMYFGVFLFISCLGEIGEEGDMR
jgi:hypothetical protein